MIELLEKIYEVASDAVILKGIERGHKLTGKGYESFRPQFNDEVILCFMEHYMVIVEDGFPKKSASFKQFPFVLEYWKKRGLSGNDAKGAAAATIHKWMKEGMSTKASSRYSKDSKRNNYIVDGLKEAEADIKKAIVDYVVARFRKGLEALKP